MALRLGRTATGSGSIAAGFGLATTAPQARKEATPWRGGLLNGLCLDRCRFLLDDFLGHDLGLGHDLDHDLDHLGLGRRLLDLDLDFLGHNLGLFDLCLTTSASSVAIASAVIVTFVPQPEASSSTVPRARSPSPDDGGLGLQPGDADLAELAEVARQVLTSLTSAQISGGDFTRVRCARARASGSVFASRDGDPASAHRCNGCSGPGCGYPNVPGSPGNP